MKQSQDRSAGDNDLQYGRRGGQYFLATWRTSKPRDDE